MSYCGYITTLKNVRLHPNADRMLLGDCFGNTVCVGLNSAEGEIGLYLPSDGQVSEEFGKQNNLLCLYDAEGHVIPGGGYLDPVKRNIKAISLRGVKSDGIFLPISCLAYTGVDLDELNIGDTVNVVNGHDICTKYIPRGSKRLGRPTDGNKTRKKVVNIAPLFAEHADTEQLAYNLGAFKVGDEIEITLKMHGTSQRTGYLPVLKRYKRTLFDRILRRQGTPIYDWGYVSGTRRTVLENFEGEYSGSNKFREAHSKFFDGKLNKGEEIFYEVVGFTHTGAPIMASGDNKKLNDKEFVKLYGQTTVFSYGCNPEGGKEGHYEDIVWVDPQSDIYVYRMTMTNEDGFIVEYTPDFMRYRCDQMGVKTVPVMWKGTIPEDIGLYANGTPVTAGDWIDHIAQQYNAGPDPIGKTHTREGVVVRILNRPKFTAYKSKCWEFKVLEGIIKDLAQSPDIEEAQEITE